jgi:hypothetical protein
MRPWDAIPSFTTRDPAMLKWFGLLVWPGVERQPHFSEDFFNRLDQDLLMVDDYGYAGIDFRNDPNLVLPKGEDWDTTLGKKHAIFSFNSDVFDVFMIL